MLIRRFINCRPLNLKFRNKILEDWSNYLPKFKKVLPEEYRQALVRLEQEQLELA